MVMLAGGEPVGVPATIELGFKIKPEALERAISAKTNGGPQLPVEPYGAAYTRAEPSN